MEQRLAISMYHYVRDLKHSRYPEIKGLDVNLFRQQIAFMKENASRAVLAGNGTITASSSSFANAAL